MPNLNKSEEYSWIWVERLFKKIQAPYPIVSLVIAVTIYLIFMFFSAVVIFFPLEFYHSLEVSTLSILIAFQLAGIQYLLNIMKKTFRGLDSYPKYGISIDDLYIKLRYRFSKSYWYYILVAAVIIPFIIIELIRISEGVRIYYTVKPTLLTFFLDAYNYATGYFMLFLMAILLWIIINIVQTLNEMRSDPYRQILKIDILNIDKIGGLKPLRDLILKVLTVYFICITLAIISYISPSSILSYESIFLIILLLVGIAFFFTGVNTIRKLLRGRIEDEINKINGRIQLEHQKLMKLISEGNYKGEELNLISTTLQTLYVERDRMLELYGSARGYDLKTIIQFSSSFVLSLIAFVEKIFQFVPEIKKIL